MQRGGAAHNMNSWCFSISIFLYCTSPACNCPVRGALVEGAEQLGWQPGLVYATVQCTDLAPVKQLCFLRRFCQRSAESMVVNVQGQNQVYQILAVNSFNSTRSFAHTLQTGTIWHWCSLWAVLFQREKSFSLQETHVHCCEGARWACVALGQRRGQWDLDQEPWNRKKMEEMDRNDTTWYNWLEI